MGVGGVAPAAHYNYLIGGAGVAPLDLWMSDSAEEVEPDSPKSFLGLVVLAQDAPLAGGSIII